MYQITFIYSINIANISGKLDFGYNIKISYG